MNSLHPILANILSLADPHTWESSAALADRALADWAKTPRSFTRVYLVGHGSSLYNGQVGESVLEHIAGLPSKAIPGFSFSAYTEETILDAHTLVVGISTTGETQSVCDALERARRAGAFTFAITAYEGSAITRAAEAVILSGGVDDQMSVKTKSYVQALIPLYLLAVKLNGDPQQKRRWSDQLKRAAEGAHRFLSEGRDQIKQLAELYGEAPKVFVLGTGPNLGTAEEASLKIIEMAKMYSECQELEDFMHGRLREVDHNSPLFFVAPKGNASRRILDFLTVTDMIHAPSIVLTDEVTPGIQRLATHVIPMPAALDEFATPLLYILPMHLFAYEMALQRGYDPDARRYNIIPQNIRYQGEE